MERKYSKIVRFIFCMLLLIGCTKDKTCSSVSMTGERFMFVGKWRWYRTIVEEWFGVGNPYYSYYTPQNQNMNYYFEISLAGEYRGYKDEVLVHSFLLSDVEFEYFGGYPTDGTLLSKLTCSDDEIELGHKYYNTTKDTIYCFQYPFNFDDEQTNYYKKSLTNWFVKVE